MSSELTVEKSLAYEENKYPGCIYLGYILEFTESIDIFPDGDLSKRRVIGTGKTQEERRKLAFESLLKTAGRLETDVAKVEAVPTDRLPYTNADRYSVILKKD